MSANNTISTVSISKLFLLELQSSENQEGLEDDTLPFSNLSDQLNVQHQGLSDSSANSGGSVVSLEETLSESSDEPAVSDETPDLLVGQRDVSKTYWIL